MPAPGTEVVTPDASEAPTADDVMKECAAVESERRLWVDTITLFLAGRKRPEDPSSAVQTASDMATIAAYDRVARLMRSDDPGNGEF
jgi:hypothetical protein